MYKERKTIGSIFTYQVAMINSYNEIPMLLYSVLMKLIKLKFYEISLNITQMFLIKLITWYILKYN